jgi:hypothetical protein
MSPASLLHRLASFIKPRPSASSGGEPVDKSRSSMAASRPISRESLAKIYAVGDSTLETYFKEQLSRVYNAAGFVQGDVERDDPKGCEDLFIASLTILRTTGERALPPGEFPPPEYCYSVIS